MARYKDLTGERFGKLVVLEIAEDHISSKGRKEKQWLCKCDCGNELVIRGSYLRSGNKTSCGCESKNWNELFAYIEKHILGYDDGTTLSKNQVLKVRGLQNGKFIANNNIEGSGNYSYEVIFNTFKFCTLDIQKRLSSMSFNDENHKFNYVLRIVEDNLNNVYIKMKKMEKSEKEAESYDIMDIANYKATFRPKENKVNDRLKHLW